MTLMEKVLKAAEPHIKDQGLTVVDGVLGINFVGVQLSNGRCHFIYLMREAIPSGDMIFPYGEQMIGMDAWEVAQWALTGAEDMQRSIGVAVLNAASPYYFDPAYNQVENFYDCVTEDTVMGVIGFMPPLIKRYGNVVKKYISFDRAVELQGSVEGAEVYPMERQAELLPECDVVTITGTTMINHTTEEILAMCTGAKHVILSGFSLPYYPEAYRGSGITALGTLYFTEGSQKLFKPLSLAAGRYRVREYTESVFCWLEPTEYNSLPGTVHGKRPCCICE